MVVKGAAAAAGERAFPRFLRVTGQRTGQNDAVVAADAVGRVVSAPVERGSVVKAGDVSAKLDERQARLSLAEAAASVELAQARLALAKNEPERNQPLAVKRAVDVSTLRLVLHVPETEVGALGIGQEVEFLTVAFPGKTFTGKLRFLGAAMREASRDLVVESLVDNAGGRLRPGFFCDARIRLREEKAVAVPVDAVRLEGPRRKVFVIASDNLISDQGRQGPARHPRPRQHPHSRQAGNLRHLETACRRP